MVLPETIVVFGATGFVGTNFVRTLAGRAQRIVAVSPRAAPVEGAEGVAMRDVLALDVTSDTVVVNLAAHRYDASGFRAAQSDLLISNVEIIGRVYDFCVKKGITEVRAAGSMAVYDQEKVLLNDEEELDLARNPHPSEAMYGWSKRIGEIYALLYEQKYGIHTLTFRLSNPYGPFDSLDEDRAHVVAAFIIRALTSEGPFKVRGNIRATRDFIFVGDVCRVFERSLVVRGNSGAYNLASGRNVTIEHLAKTILDLIGVDREIVSSGPAVSDVEHRTCVVDRLLRDWNFDQPAPLEQGLDKTIEWYRHALG